MITLEWNSGYEVPKIGESYSVIGLVWHGINGQYMTRVHYCDSSKAWYEWKRIGGEGIAQCPVIVDAWAPFPNPDDIWDEVEMGLYGPKKGDYL